MDIVAAAVAGSRPPEDEAPALEALVQAVVITDDRETVAASWAQRLAGATAQQVLATPFMMLGTHAQIAEQVTRHAERWGITRYVVREGAASDLATVLALLDR